MTENIHVDKLWTGQRVFWAVFSFFAVVMAVNAVFVYLALEHHPGVVTEHSYEEGLAFDERLAEAEEQAKLGWRGDLTASASSGSVVYRLRDQADQPVSGRVVTIRFVRAVSSGHDFDVVLRESEQGVYRSDFSPPLKGKWQAHISVKWDEDGQQRKFFDLRNVVVE